MTAANILYLVIGLIFGAGVSFLALCLVAIGRLGDDPLPETPGDRIVRHYQD